MRNRIRNNAYIWGILLTIALAVLLIVSWPRFSSEPVVFESNREGLARSNAPSAFPDDGDAVSNVDDKADLYRGSAQPLALVTDSVKVRIRYNFPSDLEIRGETPRIIVLPIEFSTEEAESLYTAKVTASDRHNALRNLARKSSGGKKINAQGEILQPGVWEGVVQTGPNVSAFLVYFIASWRNLRSSPTGMDCVGESALCEPLSSNSVFVVPQQNVCSVHATCWAPSVLTLSVLSENGPLPSDHFQIHLSSGVLPPFSVAHEPLLEGGGKVEILRNIKPNVDWKIWVTASAGEYGGHAKALASAFAYTRRIGEVKSGESRHISIDLPRLPAFRVVLPENPDFSDSHWSIDSNYVTYDKGEYSYRLGGRGYVHMPGMKTWYFESSYPPSLAALTSRARAEGVPSVVGFVDFDAFLSWVEIRKLNTTFSGTLKLIFKGKKWDPLVVFTEVRLDLLKSRTQDIALNPKSAARTFSVLVQHMFTGLPISGARVIAKDYAGHSSGWIESRETSEQGIVYFDSVPNSVLLVTVRSGGFRFAVRRYELGKFSEPDSELLVKLFPQKSGTLTLNVADEMAGAWDMARDGSIWAMVVSDQPDPMRIMHQTWTADAKEVNADGKIEFTNIPPGNYLVTVLANGRQPWVKALRVPRDKSITESFDATLKALNPADAKIELASVSQAIGQSGGMKLGFKRQFALVQGNFGDYAKRIVNILRGEIIWKRVEGQAERQPYPFLPTTLLGETPDAKLSASLDPALDTWLIGPSGAILPMIKEGDTYKPDASKTATLRGAVIGMTKHEGLIARVVPVNARNAQRSPYNVLSGVSTPIDKDGNWVVKHLLPGTYRVLLLKPNPGGDGASAVTVLNRNANAIVTLIAKEDQTFNLEPDQ